jgi:tricorn protease-like protein
MDTEPGVIDDRAQRKEIENIVESMKQARVPVGRGELGVEAIRQINGSGLVISTQEENAVGVFDFEVGEVEKCEDALMAAINVIAKEKITNRRGISVGVKKAEEIKELTVDVAADCDGGRKEKDIGFGNQNLFDPRKK